MERQERGSATGARAEATRAARLRRVAPLALAGCAAMIALATVVWPASPPPALGQVTPTPTTEVASTVGPRPTYTPPLDTTVNVPGSAQVPPGGTATFLATVGRYPPLSPSGPVLLRVRNGGSLPASVDYDGLTLVIDGGESYPGRAIVQVAVPGTVCASIDGDPTRVGCTPVPGGPDSVVVFTTAALPQTTAPAPFTFPVHTFQATTVGTTDVLPVAARESVIFPGTSAAADGTNSYGLALVNVANVGMDAVDVTDDGLALTIKGAAGAVLTASDVSAYANSVRSQHPCVVAGGVTNALVCNHGDAGITRETVNVSAVSSQQAGSPPQEQAVYFGDTVTFAVPSADGSTPGASLTVRYPTYDPPYTFQPHTSANAVLVSWDGAMLAVTGPANGTLILDCDPQEADSNGNRSGGSDSCSTAAGQPLLVTVTSELPQIPETPAPFPTIQRPPDWQPQLDVVPNSGAPGDELLFSGTVAGRYSGVSAGPFAYFWDWGDGTITEDQDATHAYASAGTYTAESIVFNEHDGSFSTAGTTVTIGAGG